MNEKTKKENTKLLVQLEQWNARGEWEKSLKAITAIAEEDRDYDICCLWAECLQGLGRGEEAIPVLASVAVTGKEDSYWWELCTHILYDLKRYDAVLRMLHRRVQRFPDDEDAQALLAMCQQVVMKREQHISFRERVAEFWQLFTEWEYRVRMLLQEGQQEEAENYVRTLLKSVFHAPVFSLTQQGQGAYLMLSTEGRADLLYGLAYWCGQAPHSLDNDWDIIIGQPAVEFIEQIAMPVGGTVLHPADIQAWPILLPDGRLALECYNTVLAEVEHNEAYRTLYQMLERCVGELCLLTTLAYIEIMEGEQDGSSILLSELRNYVADLQATGQIPAHNDPLAMYTTYDINPEIEQNGLREDIYKGSVSAAALPMLQNFYNGDSLAFGEAAMDGIVWSFLFYNCENITKAERVNVRAAIEDELQKAMHHPLFVGDCVGGASGHHYSYLDCVSYDFERFVEVVRQVMEPYIDLYEIKEAGIYELYRGGRYIPLRGDLPEPEVLVRQRELAEQTREMMEEPTGAVQYVLRETLHGAFAVQDVLHETYLELPEWGLTITPVVNDVSDNAVLVDYSISHPEWDRVVVEKVTGMGMTPQEALQVATYNFLGSAAQLFYSMTQPGEIVESIFAGQVHRWQCYPGNLMTQEKPSAEMQDYWSRLKDEVLARLGNQRICYVEFYGAKTLDFQTGVCRINGIDCPDIGSQIEQMAEQWETQSFSMRKQVIFLRQEDETWTPYPHSREELQEIVRQAAEFFLDATTDALPGKLRTLTDDNLLIEELLIFLPELCAQHAFDRITYPEQLTLERGSEVLTVYRSQIFAYEALREAFFSNMDARTLQGREDEIYSHLISISSIYAAVQEAEQQDVDLVQDGGSVNTVYTFSEDYKLR